MRIRVASRQGTLDTEASAVATTLSSPRFADLPVVDYDTTGLFLPLILDPGAAVTGGQAEIAYVTAHAEDATTVTVTRAQEVDRGGAIARIHPVDTEWHHGPTPGDWDDELLTTVINPGDPAILPMTRVMSASLNADLRGFSVVPGIRSACLFVSQGAGGGGIDIACKGYWNASTNTPALADGVGVEGDWYRVQVGDDIDLGSGTKTFVGGQHAVYDGAEWQPTVDAPGDFMRIIWSDTGDYTNPTTGPTMLDMDTWQITCVDPLGVYWIAQRGLASTPFPGA